MMDMMAFGLMGNRLGMMGGGMGMMGMMGMGGMNGMSGMGNMGGMAGGPLAASDAEQGSKAALVAQVKDMQRSDPNVKQQWEMYCQSQGMSKYDPNFHDEAFINGFFSALENGLLPEVEKPEDPEKDTLVQKVKAFQRVGIECKQIWYTYVKSFGKSDFDPNRHDSKFLKNFLTQVEQADKWLEGDWTGGGWESGWGDPWGAGWGAGWDSCWGGGWGGMMGMGGMGMVPPWMMGKGMGMMGPGPGMMCKGLGKGTGKGMLTKGETGTRKNDLDGGGSDMGMSKGAKGEWGNSCMSKGDWKSSWDMGPGPSEWDMGAGKGEWDMSIGMGKGGWKGDSWTGDTWQGDLSPAPHGGSSEQVAQVSEKIFVGALPRNSTTKEKLYQHFSQFGLVTDVHLIYDEGGGFCGFGFVSFENIESAKAVLDNYEQNEIDGKWIDCRPSHQKGASSTGKKPLPSKNPPPPTGSCLRVRGLPFSSNEEDVLRFFRDYAATGRVHMKVGIDGRPAGEAFIEFASNEDAVRAYREKQFASIGNRYIELFGATPEDVASVFGTGSADMSGCARGRAHYGSGPGSSQRIGHGISRVAAHAARVGSLRPGPYSQSNSNT